MNVLLWIALCGLALIVVLLLILEAVDRWHLSETPDEVWDEQREAMRRMMRRGRYE